MKRDGRKQEVHFDKITARIMKLSYNLNPEFCDPVSNGMGYFAWACVLRGSSFRGNVEGVWRATARAVVPLPLAPHLLSSTPAPTPSSIAEAGCCSEVHTSQRACKSGRAQLPLNSGRTSCRCP